jgi:perosamine synthetase
VQSKFPLSQPWLTSSESYRVSQAVESGWLTQAGHEVKTMEDALQILANSLSKRNYEVTSTSNGTTALHLALLSIGIKPGDEVIVPDFSYIAVINSVIYCGAIPILADVHPDTWNINPESVESLITEKSKAIIAVDNYGNISDIAGIRAVTSPNVKIIQDAAESFPTNFSSYDLELGDVITTSFYGNKILTSAEGGAVFGNSEIISKIKKLKNQAITQQGNFSHDEVGYNYRLTNVHAAIFNAQFERREEILLERKRVFRRYSTNLDSLDIIVRTNSDSNPWLYTVELDVNQLSVSKIRKELNTSGIETRPGFTPFSSHEHLKKYVGINFHPRYSLELSNKLLSFPTYPELKNSDVDKICDSFIRVLHKD